MSSGIVANSRLVRASTLLEAASSRSNSERGMARIWWGMARPSMLLAMLSPSTAVEAEGVKGVPGGNGAPFKGLTRVEAVEEVLGDVNAPVLEGSRSGSVEKKLVLSNAVAGLNTPALEGSSPGTGEKLMLLSNAVERSINSNISGVALEAKLFGSRLVARLELELGLKLPVKLLELLLKLLELASMLLGLKSML
jgi:hypothetical protein